MTDFDRKDLEKLEQSFKDLLMEQCGKLPLFREYLAEYPDFEFPKITEELLNADKQFFIGIPGMFGGFAYYFEEVNGKPVLYAERSSRMDHSSDDYWYFEITESGNRRLESTEREAVQEKFRELAKKDHEEYLRKLKHYDSRQKSSLEA